MSLFLSACNSGQNEEADKLNTLSYKFHYINLDSTYYYARKALEISDDYPTGKSEAYNNLAFVCIGRMEYDEANKLLDSVSLSTDNQIELLIADIQNMRLCQRESQNKNFYDYREKAFARLKRIEEDASSLSPHLQMRVNYAKTEFAIVNSTYYYYVGLTKLSSDALGPIDEYGEIQDDTAQYINYLYQIGSGGIINDKSQFDTSQREFEYLMRCYLLAKKVNSIYWQANALQSISEHLLSKEQCNWLIVNNSETFDYLNKDNMPDSLLAGYLAQKSLELFISYGDTYQIAGAYRTLALCYFGLDDYTSSLICLETALSNKKINQAPDLVAGIMENLSLVYSAMNDKNNSDICRNKYLDLQEETRQDRQLEARAEQLERISMQLNILILIILILIIGMIVLIFFFRYLRRKKNHSAYIEELLVPLHKWEKLNDSITDSLNEKAESIKEKISLSYLHVEEGKRRLLDNKAKIFLVNNVTPYIDRIINEIGKIETCGTDMTLLKDRYAYMIELTQQINNYNFVLTQWIQLQQGQVSLHIESFCLNELFDIIKKSSVSFRLKDINLIVTPSDCVVKADKILTLFMLNTICDNALKFTHKGGSVSVYAKDSEEYVEISIKDTGEGLSEEECSGIFDRKILNGHGFGLSNCNGIINKYHKVSRIFSVCGLFVESEKGKGCRFYFRLPHGLKRVLVILLVSVQSLLSAYADRYDNSLNKGKEVMSSYLLDKAGAYADSAYYSNIKETYSRTFEFADSALYYINKLYSEKYPIGKSFLSLKDNGRTMPAEIKWFHDKVSIDYDIILDVRNECAVAALALHEWDIYSYNNKIYTRLFKEKSADSNLAEYCQTMQHSSSNKYIAIVILVLLLITVVVAYYFIYYRHVLYFRFCVDSVNNINRILLSSSDNSAKLRQISSVDIHKYPKILEDVVTLIRESLKHSISVSSKQKMSIEFAEDELNRSKYENERLYVSNNIVENCLSALKHETMYYPSRIRQLVENPNPDIRAIDEVAAYYKELYSILSEQVQRQSDSVGFECKPIPLKKAFGVDEYVSGDKALFDYLFEIIKKLCGNADYEINVHVTNNKYVVFDVMCHSLKFTGKQCSQLFVPMVENIPFLICRQIVREFSELSNLHACGITATGKGADGINISVVLPRFQTASGVSCSCT